MKKMFSFFRSLLIIVLLALSLDSTTQGQIITTFAGTGSGGFSGDGGAPTAATLHQPEGIIADSHGNLYFADVANNRIRIITSTGTIKTFAGTGTAGFSGDGGAATAANLNTPTAVGIDSIGNIYIVDYGNVRIRKVSAAGTISTFAGSGSTGFSGDGGAATAATLAGPMGVVGDANGNVFIADATNCRIRKVNSSGIISTIAGTGAGTTSGDGGAATAAGIHFPAAVAFDLIGNMYIAESGGNCIRKINTSGIISTYAGNGTAGYSGDDGPATAAELNYPVCVTADIDGNIFIVDNSNNRIRKVDATGIITTIAGNGTAGYSGDGGVATTAEINSPFGATIGIDGKLYIGDEGNNRIRSITAITYCTPIYYYPASAPSGINKVYIVGSSGILNDSFSIPGSFYLNRSFISPITVSPGNTYTGLVGYTDTISYNYFNQIWIDFNDNHLFESTENVTPVFGNDSCGGGSSRSLTNNFTMTIPAGAAYGTHFMRVRNVNVYGCTFGSGSIDPCDFYDGYGHYYYYGSTADYLITIGATYTATPDTLIFSCVLVSTSSATLTSAVTASYLSPSSGNITITAPSNFKVSADGSTWVTSYVVAYTGGAYTGTVYAQCDPTSTGTFTGNITVVGGSGSENIWVSGCGAAACFGTPTPGSAYSYPSSGGSTTAFSLGLSGYTGAAGITYQWQDSSSATSGAWVNISGATTIDYDFTGITTTTSYRCKEDCSTYGYISYSSVTVLSYSSSSSSCSIIITTIAGNGTAGYTGDGGAATAAEIHYPYSIITDGAGDIYFADFSNNRIRKINSAGIISTIAGNGTAAYSGDGGPATAAELNNPSSISLDGSGNLYIADYNNNRIRKVNTSGIITTYAGTGSAGFSGDGGAATAALLYTPSGVAVDGSGNVYIADVLNQRIRKVNAAGIISTIAGNGTAGFAGDGGPATAAEFSRPSGIITDGAGDVFIADQTNNRIRKVTVATGIISTIAGTGTGAYYGDGGPATAAYLYSPTGVTVDGTGNVFISDYSNQRIRKINTSGIISTVAGTGAGGYSGDGGSPTAAELYYPINLAVDGRGQVYIADQYNNRIREITTGAPIVAAISGPVTVAAGATITLSDTTTGGTWSSSASSIATVSSSGVVTGVVAGGVTISYAVSNSCGTSFATYFVTVTSAASCSNIITTFAGDGSGTYSGDGGAATAAGLNYVGGIIFDAAGNFYIADVNNNRVRKITPAGIISTVAGNGTRGYTGDGGAATAAELSGPTDVKIDGFGNLYIAEYYGSRVRKVTAAGIISTLAGTATAGYSGDGGPATAAELDQAEDVFIDGSGNVYIADEVNNRIRKINTSGIISTVVGGGSSGLGDGGPATAAELNYPDAIAFDASGNMYISEYSGQRVRKVNTSGIITTIAGTGTAGYSGDGGAATAAEITYPARLIFDGSGNLYVPEFNGSRVRIINPSGIINTFAGTSTAGFAGDGGAPTAAELNSPSAICIDAAGEIYISDCLNNRIRKITTGAPTVAAISGPTTVAVGANITLSDATSGGTWSSSSASTATVSSGGSVGGVAGGSVTITYSVTNSCGTSYATYGVTVTSGTSCNIITTIAGNGTGGYTGDGGAATAAELNQPYAVAIDAAGNVFIADEYNQRIRKVTAAGVISTIAGNGTAGYSGDGGPASAAEINNVQGLAFDIAGNLYVSDGANARIRKINTSGTITTVAGNGTAGYSGDGGPATAAKISPSGIAVDWAGAIYIAEAGNAKIRKVNTSGIISTVAGTTTSGFSGDGGAATAAAINSPNDVAVDGADNFYIADAGNNRIRKVTAAGIITTYAGNGTGGYSGDGGAATAAELNFPIGVAVDPSNNVYVADYNNYRIRQISPSGVISTIAGNGTGGTTGDGGPATAAELITPSSIAIDNWGNVYFPSQGGMRVRKITTGSISVAAISGPSTVAAGSSITLTDGTSGGSWTSGNTSIATVTGSGSVTGVAVGSVVITYSVSNSCGTAVAAFEVTVTSSSTTSCNIISTFAGNGTGGYSGDGAAATTAELYAPYDVNFDASGNLYIADAENNRIRKVTPAGVISTVAGNGTAGYTGDGGAATAAELTNPCGVALDGSGNIYILDAGTSHVRKINTSGVISTIGGTGIAGYSGDGGPATAAKIYCNYGRITVDAAGNVYISDNGNNRIRKINTLGIISTFAGTGSTTFSGDGGAATAAGINGPRDICFDAAGNFYIADYGNSRIREVNASGTISTFAGTGTAGFAGDGSAATAAELYMPTAIIFDNLGNFYIGDEGNARIRRINPSGIINTVAGNGTSGFSGDGSSATTAEISNPQGLAIDPSGNLYISDNSNNRIRKLTTGVVAVGAISGPTTVAAGSTITLTDATSGGTWSSSSSSIATVSSGVVGGVAAGSVAISYSVTNSCGTTVLSYGVTCTGGSSSSCNIITTIAGNGTTGGSGDGGAATAAALFYPTGVAVDASGNIYIADNDNFRIRKVAASGIITTIAGTGTEGYSGDGGAATAAELSVVGITVDTSNNVYIVDGANNRIRKISTSGIITTVAGNGTGGYSGDGGPATAAEFNGPGGIFIDATGNMYITDNYNNVVRKVNTSGIISTIAGTGTSGYSGDGGAATAAKLFTPTGVALDATGNIYVVDGSNNRIRKINTSGIISTYAGNGTAGYSGDGGAATTAELNVPYNIAVDAGGSIYIADELNNVIRKVTTDGTITTIVGNGTAGFSGEGGMASACELHHVIDMVLDASGNIYIADYLNGRIRRVSSGVPIVAPVSGPSSVCAGANITLSDATAGGTWSSSNTVIATVSSGGVVTGISSGTATISYTVTNICGTTVVTYSVTVSAAPSAGTITGASSVCTGASVTLSDGTIGGTWSSGSSGIASVNSSGTVHGVAVGSTVISYTMSNSCGSTSATYAFSVISTPSVAAISGGTSVCAGSSITLTDGTSGGVWSSSNAAVASISTSGLVNGLAVGTTTISYIVTNACGSGFTTETFTVNALPATPVAIRGAATVCVGANTTLTDSTSGGTWSSSNASIASVNSGGLVTGVSAGSATITYTNANSCGSAYVVKTITVTGLPSVASIGGTPTVCSGLTVTLSDGTSGGAWTSSNAAIASVNSSGTVTGVSAGSTTISYSVTNSCGTTSSTIGFTVTTVPTVAAISGSSSICNGTSTTLTDGTSGGTWSSVTTSVATVNSGGTVFGVAAGTSVISYTVTNSCGAAAATKVVTVTATPTAGSITGSSTVCTGANITLVDGTSGGTWTSSNSSIASVNSGGVVFGIASGSAIITYSVTSSCGSAQTTATITVNPSPNAGTISGSATVCTGVTASLTDVASGGTWSSSSTSMATVNTSGIVTGVGAGSVTISYSVTNSCGTAVATHSMTVNPSPNAGSISGPTTVCVGTTITLTDAATGGTWSSANAAVASVNSSGVVTGVSAGSVAVSYSVTNSCGTATTGSVINVSGAPTAGTISGPTGVCTGSTITLTDGAIGGVWSSSNTAKATVTSSGVVFGVTAGSVSISYTVTSSCATVSAVSTITVSTSASAGTISGLSSVCTGATITLTTSGTAGGAWTSSNTSLASVSAGVVRGIAAGMATISYSVTSGCGTVVSTKAVTVTATPAVTAISGPTNICIGTATTYTDATSGGGWISSNTTIATVNSAGLVTAISAGTATLTYFVTNTCGTATTTLPITVNSLSAGVISGAASVAVGASTTLTNTVTGGVWSSVHTTIATISASGAVTGVSVGADSIKYSVTNVCGTANAFKIISITAHRDELPGSTVTQGENNPGVSIFPNPNTGTFTLELTGTNGEATIMVTDLTGRTLSTQTTSEKTITFDLSNYAAGTYLVRVSVDGQVYGRKVVVN